jgi:hypothetical protein
MPKAEWVLDGVVTMAVVSDVMQRGVDGRFCRSQTPPAKRVA